jgi:hypothetical protein
MKTGLDGVRCGNGSGDCIVYEVFDPPWWRVDRWFSWFFIKRNRARGTLQIIESGQPRVVRCRAVQSIHARTSQTIYPSYPLH